ncbi:ABC transporter substrate-binding protein [Streptomyces sp. NBC_00264]|uniref:ABC transporter substrate-binding protein n=1 Tax=unclassified Streptomyces TaxID=2593676 RepID=UPI0022546DF2|nr:MULTISPECIES: ABC transporter substrate-binding protein [unclassified Streptomyces]WSW99633.1 ABC transporter substrate-binding protein [Streptomyces sp. NBC_00987]MCX4398888.1 ABC transporter substrate-binding protein [Streptomyces sp. NBC_01767]MCX5158223.1 ABC transporter substrate-binding protein [Streptomyces sp. NBC_00305]MCX5216746.1 ABC transporter substrate-binding protein [Streptomyces sp. NBC_00264]WSC25964.1 ABC transporter substrate-binding protein [Streptomyces sp. NBC_01768]
MPTPRPAAIALATLLCLAAAGCSEADSGSGTDGGKAGSADKAPPAAQGTYPVTLKNCGRDQTFDKAPGRVVVMNGASVAEVSTLLALGQGDRIVSNQQTYGMSEVPGRAEEIKDLPTGGVKPNDAFDIPREAMISLRPDFVLSTTSYGFDAKNGFATREQLKAVGARTYISPEGCGQDNLNMTIDDSYTLLRDMGKVFGVEEKAEKLVATERQNIADVANKVGDAKKPKVMVIFSNMTMGGNDFSSVAAHGIYNDILAKAGGSNAFASASKTSFADLSKEKVAATDVDALVVVSYNDPDPTTYAKKLLKEFPQWPAAKKNKFVVLSDSMYLGPSNDMAVEKIARMLHPDAF